MTKKGGRCSTFSRIAGTLGEPFPALVYDARKPEDIDTAGEDHIYDETRYFLMSRPIAPRARRTLPVSFADTFWAFYIV